MPDVEVCEPLLDGAWGDAEEVLCGSVFGDDFVGECVSVVVGVDDGAGCSGAEEWGDEVAVVVGGDGVEGDGSVEVGGESVGDVGAEESGGAPTETIPVTVWSVRRRTATSAMSRCELQEMA
ncbi:hypothetical protein RU01_21645 [Rhodococcus sp. MEB064]|nr:hypothetical protein [Rhodococcus sp. MEB064]KIQ08015.1 hypothetical protein RU01_21645 [Rhodococcus sp. MEB064]